MTILPFIGLSSPHPAHLCSPGEAEEEDHEAGWPHTPSEKEAIEKKTNQDKNLWMTGTISYKKKPI